MLRLYNTLTRRKEPFRPLDEQSRRVTVYACGPTVYDSLHIGHARAFLLPDILRRKLEHDGFEVRFVTNFTDIDDKIIKRARETGRDRRELTAEYIAEYHRVTQALNVKAADAYPRATDHFPEIIAVIERLFAGGHAYVAANGDVYFHTPSFSGYGALSGRSAEYEKGGLSGRLSDAEREAKKHPSDFVLWKRAKPGEPAWPSPWGNGRPGWHIECSAMSKRLLGFPFDIHCGGADLIFPHHEDERAQNACAFAEELQGREAVNWWVHNGHLTVGGEKMSKSLGNVRNLRDLLKPAGPYEPAALRLFFLSAHYRSPLHYEPARLDESAARLERLRNFFAAVRRGFENTPPLPAPVPVAGGGGKSEAEPPKVAAARKDFHEALDDDLNTARALGALFGLVGELNRGPLAKPPADRSTAEHTETTAAAALVREALNLLGVRLDNPFSLAGTDEEFLADSTTEEGESPGGSSIAAGNSEKLLQLLMEIRNATRKAKQFETADLVRDGLAKLGCEVKDLPGGKWSIEKKKA